MVACHTRPNCSNQCWERKIEIKIDHIDRNLKVMGLNLVNHHSITFPIKKETYERKRTQAQAERRKPSPTLALNSPQYKNL